MSNEIQAMDEEQTLGKISDEIQNQNEGQKIEETLTQNQGKISHVDELDSTVAPDTLPKTGSNTIILIIIFAIGILVAVFYLKTRKNIFTNSKN